MMIYLGLILVAFIVIFIAMSNQKRMDIFNKMKQEDDQKRLKGLQLEVKKANNNVTFYMILLAIMIVMIVFIITIKTQ
ncbi:MAG: hypothetical protein KJO41_00955 [Bacteroidia bacterium]|nr:hypothetical protein [Bacteroidia bacterium]MBT8277539.1 hypothetical protein [Bacteroidia bacterium]NND26621.1 hypothetical protein [Flavobacteriaceae bacterium]